MARGEYLIRREDNAPPHSAPLPEALYRLLAVGTVLRRSGNQMRNRLAVPGYGNGLSVLDRPKEFGQTRLGLGSLNHAHVRIQPVVLTILFYKS